MADLLLKQAASENGSAKTSILHRAREAAELIKQSELEDFLGGRCAVQSNKSLLDNAAPNNTAIIYPIMLPDRLELLVSSGTEIESFTQPIAAKQLETQIKEFAASLRIGREDVNILAQKLYLNTFAPLKNWLQDHQVSMLVIAPDGVMRLIPMAALHDGEQYLIEKYAFATSPGLSLFLPATTPSSETKVLLAGLSEPGSVVNHLPVKFYNELHETLPFPRGAKTSRSIHFTNQTRSADTPVTETERLADFERLKADFKLPGVDAEISLLQAEMPNLKLLQNESFNKADFEREIAAVPYNIVHIASHGFFGSSAETSFLMASDDIIDMNDMEKMLKTGQYAQNPLDLLTLSACQTAEGDDRAPLGISGIAIKAHVRSALGSLWSVNDDSVTQLMAEFYKNLNQTGMNKAQALQQAQLTLLKQKEMENPYYWSPFILVGNWF